MSNYNSTEAIEKLAATIGENIYIEIAKWNLYLSDAHLHTLVAEKAYNLIESKSVSEAKIIALLESIPVTLGEGRTQLTLKDVIPRQCETKLIDILEEYQDN
ncbi:MAG: DUF3181 family protein [Gloeocapsa sp. DLM2.Bin57]|jgi:hypothetical protein|nr:MAG: DUF3181 family protein [Gloeocapsa sp. DLM2.Bin57]